MSRKSLVFLLVGLVYIVLVIVGLGIVYSVGQPIKEKKLVEAKTDNLIAIAHVEKFGKLERPQVIFNHKKHEDALKDEGCKACHKVNEEGILGFDFPKEIKGKGEKALMNAYHDECIGCHKKKGKMNLKSGPVTCGECHNEEEKFQLIKYPKFEFDFYVHDKHCKKLKEKVSKEDCSICHHTYDIDEVDDTLRLVYEPGTEESCYYCHDYIKNRGPELAIINREAAKKNLTMKRASHQLCLNCHLIYKDEYIKKNNENACPTECIKCHTGKYRTINELENVPRPSRGQEEKIFINIKDAKLKGVTFDHKYHETTTRTCRLCHHERLKACKECHDLIGKPEGNYINVARAYHDVFSDQSCAGCHNKKKSEKECYGCHYNIGLVDVETMSPKKESCSICHSGEVKGSLSRPYISIANLDTEKVKKEIKINVLERQFEPAQFPHFEIIKKLVDVSNKSKLANYFHKELRTLCEGCHHNSRSEAEAQKNAPPYCKNCHTIAPDLEKLQRVSLVAAYHNLCIGCHDAMQLDKGSKLRSKEGNRCADCHKVKEKGPELITHIKNFPENPWSYPWFGKMEDELRKVIKK